MSRDAVAAHDARPGPRDAVDLPPGFEFFALPPEEAIRYFRALGIEPTWDYREMWSAEQRRAFTVAKLTQLDLLEFAYREVDRGIAEGMSLGEFQQRMAASMGPRPIGRGRARAAQSVCPSAARCFNGAATNWSRKASLAHPRPPSPVRRFNGAATNWSRKEHIVAMVDARRKALQWGRDQLVAEGPRHRRKSRRQA